jgi:hypothetical protein
MAAFEFRATVLPNGRVAVPSEMAVRIPAGEEVRVTLAWDPSCTRTKTHG